MTNLIILIFRNQAQYVLANTEYLDLEVVPTNNFSFETILINYDPKISKH